MILYIALDIRITTPRRRHLNSNEDVSSDGDAKEESKKHHHITMVMIARKSRKVLPMVQSIRS